jgi:hypothetical protein
VGIQENEKNKQEKENNRVGIQEKNIYTMKEKKIKRKRKTYNERMKQPS